MTPEQWLTPTLAAAYPGFVWIAVIEKGLRRDVEDFVRARADDQLVRADAVVAATAQGQPLPGLVAESILIDLLVGAQDDGVDHESMFID